MSLHTFKTPLYIFLSLCTAFLLTAYTLPAQKPIPSDIQILLEQAEDKRCKADYAGAIVDLEKAQALYREKGNDLAALELYARTLWMAIDTDFDSDAFLKRYAKAEKEIKANLKKYPQLEAILHLAMLQKTWIDDDIERSEAVYEELQAVLKKYPNWDYAAAAASHLANAYAYCSWEPQRCFELATLSNDLVKKNLGKSVAKDDYLHYLYPCYAYYNYDNLGSVELYENDNKEACLEAYNQGRNILNAQKTTDSLHYSRNLSRMGELYSFKLENDKAIEYFEMALGYTPIDMNLERGEYLNSIGDSYITQAKDEQAIFYYKKSIANLKKVSPQTDYIAELYVDIYRSMATAYIKLDKYKTAKKYLEKIAVIPAKADLKPSWTWATWGFLYENTKEYQKAIDAHEQSIVEYRKEGRHLGSAYWNLGKIANEMEDYHLATDYFHKSLIENLPNWKNPDFSAHPAFDDIPNKHSVVDNLSDKLRSYYTYVNTNNLWQEHGESVLELSNLTVECFEYIRHSYDRESSKRSLLDLAYFTYEQAISTYLNLYSQDPKEAYLKAAFEFAEKSKSILLEDALKEENAISFGGIPDSLIQLEQSLTKVVTTEQQNLHLAQRSKNEGDIQIYKKALFEARQKQDELKAFLEKNYPKYYELKYSETEISLAAIQETLPKGTTIIEYFEGRDNIFAFSITSDAIKQLRVPKEKEYTKNLEQLRELMSDGVSATKKPAATYTKYTTQARQFYETYLAPILPEETTRLVIIPDGGLNFIAFEALLSKKTSLNNKQEMNFNALPYLLREYIVSYNYSATMWMHQIRRPSTSNNHQLLAMAAIYSKELSNAKANSRTKRMRQLRKRLSPIPGTVDEINLLKKYFGGAFYNGLEANEGQFKALAPNYGILHLAMHGIVDANHPEFSSMAFTENGSTIEDNFLHSNEIKQLDLHADLVVLSACETGFGKYQHGEGVVSLGRSFMYAGVPSVVMTLWKINDYSSIYITQLFYQNLQKGLAKDEALQQAKLTYFKTAPSEVSHPAFWAAFVQLGDYKPIVVETQTSFKKWYLGGGVGLVLLIGGLFFWQRKERIT